MIEQYAPLALLLGVAAGFGLLLVVLSVVVPRLVGTMRPNPVKESPFECGMEPVGSARTRFPVRYYLVALVFVVFDLEAVFIYPWATAYRGQVAAGNGTFVLAEMMVFILVLAVGLGYLWRRGALDWE